MPIQEVTIERTQTHAICDHCGKGVLIDHADLWLIEGDTVTCPACRVVWTCAYCGKDSAKDEFLVDWRGIHCNEEHRQLSYLGKGVVFARVNGIELKHHDFGEVSIEGCNTLFFDDDSYADDYKKVTEFLRELAFVASVNIEFIDESE